MNDVEKYISGCPDHAQHMLRELRNRLLKLFPDADEGMNYGVPTIRIGKRKFHYAAFRHHIGIYPSPEAIMAFKSKLQQYETAKGTIRFPLDQPIPFGLIEEIARYRMQEMDQ